MEDNTSSMRSCSMYHNNVSCKTRITITTSALLMLSSGLIIDIKDFTRKHVKALGKVNGMYFITVLMYWNFQRRNRWIYNLFSPLFWAELQCFEMIDRKWMRFIVAKGCSVVEQHARKLLDNTSLHYHHNNATVFKCIDNKMTICA